MQTGKIGSGKRLRVSRYSRLDRYEIGLKGVLTPDSRAPTLTKGLPPCLLSEGGLYENWRDLTEQTSMGLRILSVRSPCEGLFSSAPYPNLLAAVVRLYPTLKLGIA